MNLTELLRHLLELGLEDNEPITKDSMSSYFYDIVLCNYESNFITKEVFEEYKVWLSKLH